MPHKAAQSTDDLAQPDPIVPVPVIADPNVPQQEVDPEEESNAGTPFPNDRVVACTFVNNLLALVDRPMCTVPRILLQCYCNCLSNLL